MSSARGLWKNSAKPLQVRQVLGVRRFAHQALGQENQESLLNWAEHLARLVRTNAGRK